MRRMLAIGLAAVLGLALLSTSSFAEGEGGEYVVRAAFDSADFIVEDELVRVAGADVGIIREVDVSRPGETISLASDGEDMPGKALLMLEITDPGFQNFREDASCRIRPQSLLGEKYIECIPTQPRAAGSEPPPLIEPIPDGERGEGEYLLPIENNSRTVDIDLVNNIMRVPEVDRFRIILNELGATLAARGDDLDEVIRRANPALRETDRVLKILADQNRQLAQLAQDSDEVFGPLAEQRQAITGFITEAGATAEASAERKADLEVQFTRLPRFMRELRSTMREFRDFSDAGLPLTRDLREAAPPLTSAALELARFAPPATAAMQSLGDAAENSGPQIAASDPVIRQISKLARTTGPGAKALRTLFRSLRRSGGVDQLMAFIFNAANGFNGFDEFGHFMRAQLLVTNCVDYVINPITGCSAKFLGESSPTRAPAGDSGRAGIAGAFERSQGPDESTDPTLPQPPAETPDAAPEPSAPTEPAPGAEPEGEEGDSAATAKTQMRGMKSLYKYLMEDG
jgi:phospholipid/cholesterol/gamma-HCH transport system substrate-binding protein